MWWAETRVGLTSNHASCQSPPRRQAWGIFSAANPVMCSRAVVGTISTGTPSTAARWLPLISVVICSPFRLPRCRTLLLGSAPIPSFAPGAFRTAGAGVPLCSDAISLRRVVGGDTGGDASSGASAWLPPRSSLAAKWSGVAMRPATSPDCVVLRPLPSLLLKLFRELTEAIRVSEETWGRVEC